MKKAKLTLALVAGLAATIGLSSCDDVTYNEGVVLTYVDASGKRVDYTAAQLLGEYQDGTGAASTDFDKVYELLIRNYYNSDSQKVALNSINKEATNQVNGLKNQADENASSNGTSYEQEFEKILDSNGVKNENELFSLKQYEIEKKRFEQDFYNQNIEALRDGTKKDGTPLFDSARTEFGPTDLGYLKEKLPYHVRHILVKVSASNNELVQGHITKDEATSLGTVVKLLAGDGSSSTSPRQTFGSIAGTYSGDGSNTTYGDLQIMDKSESYVQEFKLGMYAYDALYNKTTSTAWRTANKANLLPNQTKTKVLEKGVETNVYDYFANGEKNDAGNYTGIGQIPYGAALALINSASIDGSNFEGGSINNSNESFYPRNVLFNKYFNKHNVCVITPNNIAYNDPSIVSGTVSGTEITDEKFNGVLNADFAALPGFSVDTTDILPGFANNVLTDSEGHIVLAVRAGSSGSYEGIHFIVIERSALDQYGVEHDTANNKYVERTTSSKGTDGKYTADYADLSDYYTVYDPSSSSYPQVTIVGGTANLTTFVNRWNQKTADYKDRAEKVVDRVKSHNSSMNTFIFEWLIENQSITFKDTSLQNKVFSYVKNKRTKSAYDLEDSWEDAWKTYAEYLIHQDAVRAGNGKGTSGLISETCAIGYKDGNVNAQTNKEGTIWGQGGACYGK